MSKEFTIKNIETKLEMGMYNFTGQEVALLLNTIRVQKELVRQYSETNKKQVNVIEELQHQLNVAAQRLGFYPTQPMKFKGDK